MAYKGIGSRIFAASLVGLWLIVLAVAAPAAEVYKFANGITATLYSAEEIRKDLIVVEDGVHSLVHPSAGRVALDDLDGKWVSFERRTVLQTLSSMNGFVTDVDVDVFLLPAPPAEIGSSFARRGAIYLSPGWATIPEQTMAYITAHEMGHVLTWAFLDGYPDRWDAYVDMRGLSDANFAADVRHADDAREILAEDIRALFGGSLATFCGSIENHDLALPSQVTGLSDLLAGFFENRSMVQTAAVSTAFPNPCNPMTTIEMSLPTDSTLSGDTAVLRIFDIRGTLVRTIKAGYVANDHVTIQWNGTSDGGQRVASGRYIYVMQLGEIVSRGSVTLLK